MWLKTYKNYRQLCPKQLNNIFHLNWLDFIRFELFLLLKKTLDHAQCHALKLKQNEYYIYRYTHLCHCVEF